MEQHRVRWTYVLIAAMVLVFLAQNLTNQWVILAFIPRLALRYPWMFVTSIFLHASIDHLLVNMLVLFFFGAHFESRLGPARFLAVFLAAGVVGNIGYMFTAANLNTPGLGASGAIYGVMGVLAVLEPFLIVYVGFVVPLPLIITVVGYALLDVFGLYSPDTVAHGAHLGGLLLGVLWGAYLRLGKERSS